VGGAGAERAGERGQRVGAWAGAGGMSMVHGRGAWAWGVGFGRWHGQFAGKI